MKQKNFSKLLLTHAYLLLTFLLVFTACDSNSPEITSEEDLTYLSASIAQDLSLSSKEASELKDMVEGHKNREPGYLWTLAAELQTTLTDDQKAKLLRMLNRDMNGAMRGGLMGLEQGKPGHMGVPGEFGFLRSILTDDQLATIESLQEALHTQAQSIRQQVQDGSITQEEARAQVQALREQLKADIEALLTDDQKAAIEAHRAEVETEREAFLEATLAVRNDVLGLTADQIVAWDALDEARKTLLDAIRTQIENGEIDRETAKASLETIHTDFITALENLLSAEQFEIVQIHHALQMRMGKAKGMQGMRPNSPNGGRPNGASGGRPPFAG